MTCISTISIVRKNWIPGIDNTHDIIMRTYRLHHAMSCGHCSLYLYSLSLVTNSLLLSRVTFSLSRGCSRLRCLAPTEVVSGQVSQHPAVTRHLPPHPPSRSRPSIFPEPVATLSSPGLRTLTHRHFLITRVSLAALSVLPDNSKYVPIWWCVVRQNINNSFPRTRISQMYSLSH